MSSPPKTSSLAPKLAKLEDVTRQQTSATLGEDLATTPATAARHSPTLTRHYDPAEVAERQRTMDVDFAIQLSRARSASIAKLTRPSISLTSPSTSPGNYLPQSPVRDGRVSPPISNSRSRSVTPPFTIQPIHNEEEEEEEFGLGGGGASREIPFIGEEHGVHSHRGMLPEHMHLSYGHDPDLLVGSNRDRLEHKHLGREEHLHGSLPHHEPSQHQPTYDTHEGISGGPFEDEQSGQISPFNFAELEEFAKNERIQLGLPPNLPTNGANAAPKEADLRRKLAQVAIGRNGGLDPPTRTKSVDEVATAVNTQPSSNEAPAPSSASIRQRKISDSQPAPRKGGKLALFESTLVTSPRSHSLDGGIAPPATSHYNAMPFSDDPQEDRPYRFSFYSNAVSSTIHSKSLCELPADGQTFKDLFGPPKNRPGAKRQPGSGAGSGTATPSGANLFSRGVYDEDECTWWLDIISPTDAEMRALSKAFGIHPLTAEDILMEETREKIELFRNYYLVCFRSFDQDPYSPTHLEPINYYIVVFRQGTISFHFRESPHPLNVRRRIKQLKDYISVTSDWISYALIDDITDAFGPLIQGIEYEVDNIDELVLMLRDTEQSDMLRRIGTCRKKVMGLLRLMGNKADVVKGLAKRCNENWSMAPKSDIGLYLSDIQDHLITMTQSLNHYEKLLSRSHSNYLAQISIEMTDANNQINDVLSRLTALGTILIPMNLVTGLWGMNVHVPGEDTREGYAWFIGIICILVGFGVIGGILTYRLMRRGRR